MSGTVSTGHVGPFRFIHSKGILRSVSQSHSVSHVSGARGAQAGGDHLGQWQP